MKRIDTKPESLAAAKPWEAICRADGVRPFNNYLWPTESWWLGHEQPRFDPRWHFGIIALADGRFATEGFVWSIYNNSGLDDTPCVFANRKTAIRVAAARLIRKMRGSRKWEGYYGGMTGAKLAEAIKWVRSTAARETDDIALIPVAIADPTPRPVIVTLGLPLFDRQDPLRHEATGCRKC